MMPPAVSVGERVAVKAHFQQFAEYNAWANRRLYDTCARLDPAEFVAPRAGFFPSIQRTLNHILVADRIWMGRFEGMDAGIAGLDQVLYDDFDALRAARDREDARIRRHVERLPEAALGGELAYRNMAGEARRTERRWALAHFFNHQTHHRGQAHAMLSATAVTPPALDLLYFLPEDRAEQ